MQSRLLFLGLLVLLATHTAATHAVEEDDEGDLVSMDLLDEEGNDESADFLASSPASFHKEDEIDEDEFIDEEETSPAASEDESSTGDDVEEEGHEAEEAETQQLLEEAVGCHARPRLSRCVYARKAARRNRAWCLLHLQSRSPRCHRLDALERLLYGRTGTARIARDLVRKCAGQRLNERELKRLRRVLIRRYINDRQRSKMLSILRRCDLTKTQMLQLKRILRIHQRQRNIRTLEYKNRRLNQELARLESEERSVSNKRWVTRLEKYVGDAEDVKEHWVKKIIASARTFDPCKGVDCPADSYCRHGRCWKQDLCKDVQCNNGYYCSEGQCVANSCINVQCGSDQRCYLGSCVPLTSCKGVTCASGLQCVKGQCIDLTKPVTCKTLKCPAEHSCVDGPNGASCVATKEQPDPTPAKRNAPTEGPASWSAGKWSDCSVPCGQPGGYRTRLVMCKYPNGDVAPEPECAASSEKPTESGDCECSSQGPEFNAEPEQPASDSCPKRCGATKTYTDCSGGSCEEKTKACGRASCTVPDYKTIMRVCRGGSWTHCNCPSGYYPVSGGCDGTTWPHRWQYNNWNGANGWLCGGHKGKKTVHVLCARGMGACRWQTSDGGDWHRQLCPADTTAVSGGCNALQKPYLMRWNMQSGNGWLCGGWNGKKRTSVLCCDSESMRKGCQTFTRKFGDWGHLSCPSGSKLISGGCDSDKPFLIRSSRPINRRTWQCGGWGGDKTITIKCCPDSDDY